MTIEMTKPLSGGARGLLKDLDLLNAKTTSEMMRGIRESYLDTEGAIALADKLGVDRPRVKRRFYRYFTSTRVMSIAVDAYDAEQADAEAARLHEINVAHGDIHYGSRSRFNTDSSAIRVVHSAITSERPQAADVPNPHPWDVERDRADQSGGLPPRHVDNLNYNTLVVD
jgi:hypothetical protein